MTSARRMIPISLYFFHIIFLATLVTSIPSFATEADDVRVVAEGFDNLFDTNQSRQAWNSYVSQYFRDRVTEEAFVAQMSIFRSNFGGAPTSPRQLIQTQSGTDPATGQPIYSLRYKVQFPSAQVYQDTTFIKEGLHWMLAGIYFNPVAP